MRVLVTGSEGYIGSVLVPKLLAAGHEVDGVDIGWFTDGCGIDYITDFRGLQVEHLKECDAIIHLAAIANDPTALLDTTQTWKVNAFGTMDLAEKAAAAGVKQFIYASSGSVYGVSDEPQVTEESKCVPVSAYNETKKVAERCLLSYSDRMAVQILRPATVCGMSPRMRLDVAVNMLTMQALRDNMIVVLGGKQFRPNIHIEDMTDLYLFMLDHPELTGIYNAGFQNMRIEEIALAIAIRTGATIKIKSSNDPRSYRMNSDKLLATGFKPKRSVQMAIAEIEIAYKTGKLKDEDNCYNLRTMQKAAA